MKKGSKKSHKQKRHLSHEDSLSLYSELHQVKKQMEEMTQGMEQYADRIEDAEIHINLLTRLLTTLCVEKFGMRVGVLKRLLQRIEKEAIRDSQISHLESLYNLPHQGEKKPAAGQKPHKKDPWDDIS